MIVRRDDFAIPPKADRGDVDRDAIHLAVGQALHHWEKVEHFFGELYAAVLGAVVPVGALRAYGSVSAFSNRQTMLTEAADALWHWAPNDELEREFKLMRTVASEAAARRAEIAHGIVISENGDDNHFLVPSFHSSRKRNQANNEKYAFTTGQIAAISGKFNLLATDVYQLEKRVRDWREASTKKRAEAASELGRRFHGPRLPADPIKLTLTDGATRQLDAAIDAFERGDFHVAITLAGAAEGMLKRDGNYVFAGLLDNPRAKERFDEKKDWIALLNRERDWLKHGGDDVMEIECFDAAMMVARAASKLEVWTSKMEDFRVWFLENLDCV